MAPCVVLDAGVGRLSGTSNGIGVVHNGTSISIFRHGTSEGRDVLVGVFHSPSPQHILANCTGAVVVAAVSRAVLHAAICNCGGTGNDGA